MKILLVDDDESILTLLSQYLSGACGHEVTACPGGAEALSEIDASDEDFDCFVLDIQMPRMDGIELCRHIRALEQYGGTSIIMLTAMTQLDHLDRAFAAGANDYITKPFELGELRARIKSAQRFAQEAQEAQARQPDRTAGADHRDDDAGPVGDGSARRSAGDVVFSDVIDIRNVDRVLSYTAFENYIMQLPRFGMFNSTICSIRIVNAEEAHQTCPPDRFRDLIHLVAGVLSETLTRDGCFLSYRGGGVFLCIQNGRHALTRDEIERPLNRRLEVALATFPVNLSIELAVGKPHPLRWVTKSGVLKVLFNAARDAAEEAPPPPPEPERDVTLLRLDDRLAEPSPGTQGYKSMLNELLSEEEVSPRHLYKFGKRKKRA